MKKLRYCNHRSRLLRFKSIAKSMCFYCLSLLLISPALNLFTSIYCFIASFSVLHRKFFCALCFIFIKSFLYKYFIHYYISFVSISSRLICIQSKSIPGKVINSCFILFRLFCLGLGSF